MSESQRSSADRPDVQAFLLGIGGDSVQFGSTFSNKLQDVLHTMDPASIPDMLAGIILDAPTNNEGWQAYNVRAGTAEQLYSSIGLQTLARASEDPVIANALIDRLNTEDVENVAHRMRILERSMHTRMLVTPGSSIEACVNLSVWALQFASRELLKINPFHAGIASRTPGEAEYLQFALLSAGYVEFSDQVAARVQELHELARRAAEQAEADAATRKLDAERRAAEQARRRAEEIRRDQIFQDPYGAMLEYTRNMNISSVDDIQRLDTDQIEYVMFAAHVIVDRVKHGAVIAAESEPLHAFAVAIMDRVVNLQRAGHGFQDIYYSHYTSEYEKSPIIFAKSEETFWDELAKYAEWHDLDARTVGSLYASWKAEYVDWQRVEHAKRVIEESDLVPEEFLPEGCINIEVVPTGGTVVYDDINELLQNMRSYYVPRSERFDSFMAAHDLITTSTGMESEYGRDLLHRLNKAAGVSDEGNMDRLEREILVWLATDEDEWHDSYDTGIGDPYKYMLTTFSGQCISIKRVNGQFALSIVGGGYNYNYENPADFIEKFAILNNRNVTYDNGMSINYYADPPETIDRVARRIGNEDVECVKVDIPLGNIFNTLGSTLGVHIADVDDMVRLVVNSEDHRGPEFQLGDYAIRIKVRSRQMSYDDASATVTGYQVIVQKVTGGEEYPLSETKTEVGVSIDLPGALQQVIQRALAAKTIIHSRPMHMRDTYRNIEKVAA